MQSVRVVADGLQIRPTMVRQLISCQRLIGDLYTQEGNWAQAEEFYLKAQKTGLYGDRAKQVPQRLEEVRKMKGEPARGMTPHDLPHEPM